MHSFNARNEKRRNRGEEINCKSQVSERYRKIIVILNVLIYNLRINGEIQQTKRIIGGQ